MEEQATAFKALRQAIQLEKEGRKFYLQAAEGAIDPRGEEMFRSLAEDEESHLRIVQRQYQALTSGEGWVREENLPERPIDLGQPLFPPSEEAMKEVIAADASDIEALHFALELENNAYNMYGKAAEETTEPAGKAMYEHLAGMERDHFNLLMANYEYFSTAGRWLGLNKDA